MTAPEFCRSWGILIGFAFIAVAVYFAIRVGALR